MNREPTWKEALKVAHEQTRKKPEPMLKAILEVYIEKYNKKNKS